MDRVEYGRPICRNSKDFALEEKACRDDNVEEPEADNDGRYL